MALWCKSSADSLPISCWPFIAINISRNESASIESENYGLISKMRLGFWMITPQGLSAIKITPMQKPNRTVLDLRGLLSASLISPAPL